MQPSPQPSGASPGHGRWLRRWPQRPAAQARVVCLPHAGGGASAFRAWSARLPETVELVVAQYPGREDRFSEPWATDMSTLVDGVTAELTPLTDRPYVLFGHSMGSAVAYEVAHGLLARGAPASLRLIASGRAVPRRAERGQVHLRDDEGLCDELLSLGGTAPEVLADAELRAIVLGYVRADYRVIETWEPPQRPALPCPVTAFTGDADPRLDPLEARHWAALGTGPVDVAVFPGNHFYLGPQRAAVIDAVLARLSPVLRPTHPSTP